ncbi:MAG: HAD domain-containing protein, partial [Flavobacterium sp.]
MRVFLDIDGVMVHGNPNKRVEMAEDGFYVFLDEAVDVFNTIPVEEIILSTSHKNRFTLEQWKELLTNRGLQFDKVSRVESESLTRSRREEIMWWIAKKSYDTNEIIILDD